MTSDPLQSRRPPGAAHRRSARAPVDFYARLCGWRPERIDAGAGSYLALELGERDRRGHRRVRDASARCGCPTSRSPRSPRSPSGRARSGASVLLEPREGPAGWRSVVAAPAGGEIAFWQPKR